MKETGDWRYTTALALFNIVGGCSLLDGHPRLASLMLFSGGFLCCMAIDRYRESLPKNQ